MDTGNLSRQFRFQLGYAVMTRHLIRHVLSFMCMVVCVSMVWELPNNSVLFTMLKNVVCYIVSVPSVPQTIPFLILPTRLENKETLPILDNEPEGGDAVCLP